MPPSRADLNYNVAIVTKKRLPGALVKVPLGKGFHTYARVMKSSMAFYDARTSSDLSFDAIQTQPILFMVPVMHKAVTSGRWPVVGVYPLEPRLQKEPAYFNQDILNPKSIEIYQNGKTRKGTRREAARLEAQAVWSAPHVEDRLRDHYAGRPNRWVDSLKLK